MTRTIAALLGAVAMSAFMASAAWGDAKQPIDKAKNSCTNPIRHWEAKLNLPPYLLEAISLAESGRWDPQDRASFAWPWTVTAGGEGTFYDSREAALDAVRALKKSGKSNIDVGCMQINLHYHPDAFTSLEDAFDPMRNVEYAARFLSQLYATTHSWPEAAAAYHSMTPEHNRTYKQKVTQLWNGVRESRSAERKNAAPAAAVASAAPTSASRISRVGLIDYARTNELNRRFRESRSATRAVEVAASDLDRKAALRRAQLDAWRERQTGGLDLVHLSAMQRAEEALRQKQRLQPSAMD